jgi:hypothetical protein
MTFVELILDTVDVSHTIVVGMMCKESRRHVNVGLLCLARDLRFASLVVTPWATKQAVALTHPYILSHKLPFPPHLIPCT